MTTPKIERWRVTRRMAAVGALSGAVMLQNCAERTSPAAAPEVPEPRSPLRPATADSTRKVVSLEAPDDVFVEQLTPDGAVEANQVLMTLRSPRLERFQSRIATHQAHIAIVERPLIDGRVDA